MFCRERAVVWWSRYRVCRKCQATMNALRRARAKVEAGAISKAFIHAASVWPVCRLCAYFTIRRLNPRMPKDKFSLWIIY